MTLPTPTRSGYTFVGWATSADATTGTTGSFTPTATDTLYAIWK
ncbi:InlB B-repeat-containing protein [uncultured Campylobacter sp.]